MRPVEGNLIDMPPSDLLDSSACSLLLLLATPAEEDGLVEAARDLNLGFVKLTHHNLGKYFWFGKVGAETLIASRP